MFKVWPFGFCELLKTHKYNDQCFANYLIKLWFTYLSKKRNVIRSLFWVLAWSTTTQGNRFFRGHFRQQLKPPFWYVESSIVLLKFKLLNYFEKLTMKLSKKTLLSEFLFAHIDNSIKWGLQLFGLGFLLFLQHGKKSDFFVVD